MGENINKSRDSGSLKVTNRVGRRKYNTSNNRKFSDDYLFSKDSIPNRRTIKQILMSAPNFVHMCVLCNNIMWGNKLIPLVLDHIDGDRYNNTRENLRFICPNCDHQLPTFAGKNRKENYSDIFKKKNTHIIDLINQGLSNDQIFFDLKISNGATNRNILNNLRDDLGKHYDKPIANSDITKDLLFELSKTLSLYELAIYFKVNSYTIKRKCKDFHIDLLDTV